MKGKTIYLQIDGATPHVGKETVEWFNRKADVDGFHIVVIQQPARPSRKM